MAVVANATPLIALDAVVIDTETTGLDPGKARVVELAAVRLTVGRVDNQGSFRRVVRPDEPIPPAATRVHGIDDAAVADAPPFAETWPEFARYLGDAVLIGHSIGFDLAVLRRECERIGATWRPPRSLDIRLLAQVAEPNLADYSLENLAAWLDVEVAGRHSALGDAFCRRADFLRSGAEAARARHPDAGRGEARLGRADKGDRPTASRRLGRARQAAAGGRYRCDGSHRQPSVSPSGRRDHERAGPVRRRRGASWRGP